MHVKNDAQLIINSNNEIGGITGFGVLTLGSGAKVKVTPGSAPSEQIGLSLAPTSLLDLTNNSLTLFYYNRPSPDAAVRNYISSGYNVSGSAPWTGAAGITSSSAAADPVRHSIAFADGSDGVVTNLPAGVCAHIPYGGTLPNGVELIAYAYAADANLDGKVDFSDFTILTNHFGGNFTKWVQGNFNYDNTVDFSDFIILSNNFGDGGNGTGATPIQLAQYNAMAASFGISKSQIAAWDAQIAALPEPTSVTLLAAGTLGLLSRRRCRTRVI